MLGGHQAWWKQSEDVVSGTWMCGAPIPIGHVLSTCVYTQGRRCLRGRPQGRPHVTSLDPRPSHRFLICPEFSSTTHPRSSRSIYHPTGTQPQSSSETDSGPVEQGAGWDSPTVLMEGVEESYQIQRCSRKGAGLGDPASGSAKLLPGTCSNVLATIGTSAVPMGQAPGTQGVVLSGPQV